MKDTAEMTLLKKFRRRYGSLLKAVGVWIWSNTHPYARRLAQLRIKWGRNRSSSLQTRLDWREGS